MSERDPSPSSSSSFSSSSSGSGSVVDDIQEVKGLTFGTIRSYLIETHGQAKWDALMDKLPLRTHRLYADIQSTEWYPETEMRRLVHAIAEHYVPDDEEAFLALFRGVAAAGISRFFRMILTLASGQFVLRNIPTFWRRLRRGPASLTAKQSGSAVRIHYDDFRYCRDPLYRLLSIANCQAAALASCGKIPKASVEVWDRHSMTLLFEFEDA